VSRRRQRGFTLVELLIGITILLVVVTAAHTSFSIGLRARRAAREREEKLQTVRTWIGRFEDDLRNLVAARPAVALEESTVSLLRHAPPPRDDADEREATALVRVRYRVEESEHEITCTREELPVPWSALEEFDAVTALGYERRGSEIAAADAHAPAPPGADALEVRGWRMLRWVALRLEEGEWVEEPFGVQASLDAIRVELDVSSPGGAHEITFRLPPRWLP